MKIVIIDNASHFIDEIKDMVKDHEVVVTDFGAKYPDADLYILSGGHLKAVENDDGDYGLERELIKNTDKPIFGICLGFELIVQVFGGKLVRHDYKEKGITKIEVVQEDPVLAGFKTFEVYENHRWVANDLSPELVGLAKSDSGWETVRHRTKPIYGVQFHPEHFLAGNGGREVFEGFMEVNF